MKEKEVIALERGPGTAEKKLIRTKEGIRVQVATKVFVALVAQASRGQFAYDQMSMDLAKKAFKCADAFVYCWENQP